MFKEVIILSNIPEHDQKVIEQMIYLPILLTLLDRDIMIFKSAPFKIKDPYAELIERTMNIVHNDLRDIKRYLHQNNIKVQKVKSDAEYTKYLVVYKGYWSYLNYYGPR